MKVKITLPNKEVTTLEKCTKLKEDKKVIKHDKLKMCGICTNSKLKFTIFSDLKDVCTCKILKGKFSLTKENNCNHYDYNSNWEKRLSLADMLGEDIIG